MDFNARKLIAVALVDYLGQLGEVLGYLWSTLVNHLVILSAKFLKPALVVFEVVQNGNWLV